DRVAANRDQVGRLTAKAVIVSDPEIGKSCSKCVLAKSGALFFIDGKLRTAEVYGRLRCNASFSSTVDEHDAAEKRPLVERAACEIDHGSRRPGWRTRSTPTS